MIRALEKKVFLCDAPKQVRYVGPLDYVHVDQLSQRVLAQLGREFGVVTPITMHLSRPLVMAAVWGIARESLIAAKGSRPLREAIATLVSRSNACPYCVDVHSGMLHASGDREVRSILLEGGPDDAHGVSAVLRWASLTLESEAALIQSPPFASEEAPQFIGTAVAFHYVNRMVNIFLDESPVPLPKGLKWLKGAADRLASATLLKRVVHRSAQPGELLLEVDGGDLPAAFAWAKRDPAIARAFATLAAVMENEVGRSLDDNMRDVVENWVNDWHGDDVPLANDWLEDALAPLDPSLRAQARLALLTAVASHRVTEEHVHAFRQRYPSNASLISVTSWGAYIAAKRVSSWLRAPPCGDLRALRASSARFGG